MARFCGGCGAALADGSSFCAGCGQPAPSSDASPPPYQAPPATAYPAGYATAAAVPAYSPGSAIAALAGAQEPPGLTVSAPLQVQGQGHSADSQQIQDFHNKVISRGDSIAASFGHEPTGFVKVISWMVRATFLDARVARAAAQDTNGNGSAVAALALTAAPGVLIGALVSSGMGFRMGLFAGLITTVLLTVASLLVMLFALSALSQKIVEVKLGPGVLLRVLAYAQTAMIIGSIPLLGALVGPIARIWSIVASAVAIREVSGTKTEKAILFAAIGAVVQVCTWMTLSVIAARISMALNIR